MLKKKTGSEIVSEIVIEGYAPSDLIFILKDQRWEGFSPSFRNRCPYHQGEIFRGVELFGHFFSSLPDPVCGAKYRFVLQKYTRPDCQFTVEGYAPLVLFDLLNPKELEEGVVVLGHNFQGIDSLFKPKFCVCKMEYYRVLLQIIKTVEIPGGLDNVGMEAYHS